MNKKKVKINFRALHEDRERFLNAIHACGGIIEDILSKCLIKCYMDLEKKYNEGKPFPQRPPKRRNSS